MTGRHAAEQPPSRPGLAVAVLGLLGLLPPGVILAPDLAGAATARPTAHSRPDLAPHTATVHACRCGPRTAL